MKLTAITQRGVFIVSVLALLGISLENEAAAHNARFGYSKPAEIRVWVGRGGEYIRQIDRDVHLDYDDDYEYDDRDYDVYPSYDDVTVYVRASRDCYATVFVVDTEGCVRVIYPLSPYDNAYFVGGEVYSFSLGEFGLYGGSYPSGIAFVYAVTSPMPFNFAQYGVGIFGRNFAFQIYGDPFVASRHFYASIVPAWCDAQLIGVGYSRFYVRKYVRYPRYLCVGWHDYHGVRGYCAGDCAAFRYYRIHARNPYRIIHLKYKIKGEVLGYTALRKVSVDYRDGLRAKVKAKDVLKSHEPAKRIVKFDERRARKEHASVGVKGVSTKQAVRNVKVHSSREDFLKGKRMSKALREHSTKKESENSKAHAPSVKKIHIKKSPAKAEAAKGKVKGKSTAKAKDKERSGAKGK